MGITGTPVRRAILAAVATPAAMLLATGVLGLLAPGDAHAERGKHHGYGTHSPSPRPHSPSPSMSPDHSSPSPSRSHHHSPSPSLSAHQQSPWPSETPRGHDDHGDDHPDEDGHHHDGDDDDELPRTGGSGPSTGTLTAIGSTVVLGGAAALWLAALLNRRRPQPTAPSPRPRR